MILKYLVVVVFSVLSNLTNVTANVPTIEVTDDLTNQQYDSIVVVAPSVSSVSLPRLKKALEEYAQIDRTAENGFFMAPVPGLAGGRVVFSGTGPMDQDVDDVRSFGDAAQRGIQKAVTAGSKAPILVMAPSAKFKESSLVTILGALKALYYPPDWPKTSRSHEEKSAFPRLQPLCAPSTLKTFMKSSTCYVPDVNYNQLKKLAVFNDESWMDISLLSQDLQIAAAIEEGKILCRDIGGSDPETMAPPRVAKHIISQFEGSNIMVNITTGQKVFEAQYPCFARVNRAANAIPRHQGNIIWLTYDPGEPIKETLMLVGKGVTFDSGGANIKIGEHMLGMSRDKGGAAIVAGFMKAVSILKPKGLKVIGVMPMVRNSIGADAYVPDEIINARSGRKILNTNSDAEGRLEMVDVLSHLREMAVNEVNPHLMTIATLTGAAMSAVGPYTAVMDNGPARQVKFAQSLSETGEIYGDQFEIALSRRDDFQALLSDGLIVSVPSSIYRNYQIPFAFLQLGAGLDNHQTRNEVPLKYTHLDVAGYVFFPERPTAIMKAPVVTALTMHFIVPNTPNMESVSHNTSNRTLELELEH